MRPGEDASPGRYVLCAAPPTSGRGGIAYASESLLLPPVK